ncbi:hypothetical protein DCO58_11310 [Helicobacter saguini]|uniref:Uncharacterized protein n=1 Tax=Helicobacter saguini TaxID=1548018 RepID=A0A347VQ15_9HELI|nr:hypothetical protein [Helicobacter saguini]MWV61121.1 hypothetical protein [Helicobacter saguini]MWV68210.1 hypothetical protein [Helicobacter saguini]MWV70326.1 hypothetical protein [Helicobacter saguini]MWV72228.1 hypothetical protein [Helicobacter saguini]TLD95277.1 hypothetical protein LS64_002670 [Helicobacter saguini]
MGYVGIFWAINNDVKAVKNSVKSTKQNGGVKEYGAHINDWNLINDTLPRELQNESPYFYPRGRVTYNATLKQYTIFINATLNSKAILDSIKSEFNLANKNIKIDSKDIHYNSPDIPILEPFDEF